MPNQLNSNTSLLQSPSPISFTSVTPILYKAAPWVVTYFKAVVFPAVSTEFNPFLIRNFFDWWMGERRYGFRYKHSWCRRDIWSYILYQSK